VITLSGSGPVLLQSTLHRTMEEEQERNDMERHSRGGGLLDRL
jgi:hypothetical protein